MTPLADLTPCVEVLPATAAGKGRALHWFRNLRAEGYATDAAFVVLDGGVGCDAYGVSELPARGGRLFRVAKCGAAGDGPYTVFCSAAGVADSCDCKAGTFRRAKAGACRHLLALRAALANG